jgi:N-acetylglutamate synthase/N-acetylornithine aminotransferase|tara:strand:- start:550 stop:1170 length:621 start_codon:yes stop_codon:yes gene_type:complete
MKLAGAKKLVEKLLGTRAGKAMLAPATKEMAKASVPGAVLNTGFTAMAGGGIPAALATGALDMGLSTVGGRLAGKVTPERLLKVIGTGAKREKLANLLAKADPGQMTTLQALGMGTGSIAASMATLPLYPSQQMLNLSPQQLQQAVTDPSVVNASLTTDQQNLQRAYLNQLQSQVVAPDTMFQMQGIPQAEFQGQIDPYNLNRGQF